MTTLGQLIRNHVEYTIWATDRLLNAAKELSPDERERDFGTATKSVQGTLAHVLQSERMWLRRIQEGSPDIPRSVAGDEQWDCLLERWPAIHEAWRDWAARLPDEEADTVIDYTDLKGNQQRQPALQILLHVVNHATHHRGQVSGFLRALGRTPPPLDFIAFAREIA
jgi:uncharacterized damage-inducible protein DinB